MKKIFGTAQRCKVTRSNHETRVKTRKKPECLLVE